MITQKKIETKNIMQNKIHVRKIKKKSAESSFISENKEDFLNLFINSNNSPISSKPLDEPSKMASKNKNSEYFQKKKMINLLSIPLNKSQFNERYDTDFYNPKKLNTISLSFNKKLHPPPIQIYEINMTNKLQLNKIHNSKIKHINNNRKYHNHSTYSSNSKKNNNNNILNGNSIKSFEDKEDSFLNNTINYIKNDNNFNIPDSIPIFKKIKVLNSNRIPRPQIIKKNLIKKNFIINENNSFYDSYEKINISSINYSSSPLNKIEIKKYNDNLNKNKNDIIPKPNLRYSGKNSIHYLKNMEKEGIRIFFKKIEKNDCIDLISQKDFDNLKRYSLSIPTKHINIQDEDITKESNLVNTIDNKTRNIFDFNTTQCNNLRKKYNKKLSHYLLKNKIKKNIIQKKNRYKLINLNEKIKQERINRSQSKSRSKEKRRKIIEDKNVKDGPFATAIKKEDDIGGKIDLTYNYKIINKKKQNFQKPLTYTKEMNMDINRSIVIVNSTKIIQKWWRNLLKKLFIKFNIIKIQTILRGFLFRKKYIHKIKYDLKKVILIQKKWKEFLFNRYNKQSLFSFKKIKKFEINDIFQEDSKSSSDLISTLIPFRNDTLEMKSYESENFNEIYTINKDSKNYMFTKIIEKNIENKLILIQNKIKLFLFNKKQLENEMNNVVFKKNINNIPCYINKQSIEFHKKGKELKTETIGLSLIQKRENKNISIIKRKYSKTKTNKILEKKHKRNIINYIKNTEFSINSERKQEIIKNLPINLLCYITKQNLLLRKKQPFEFNVISKNTNEFICNKKKKIQFQISNNIQNSYLLLKPKTAKLPIRTELLIAKVDNNEIKAKKKEIKFEISSKNNNKILPIRVNKKLDLLYENHKEIKNNIYSNLIKLPSIKKSYFTKNLIAYKIIFQHPLNNEVCYYSKIKKDIRSLKKIKNLQEYFIYYLIKKRKIIYIRTFSKQVQLNSIITKIRKDNNILNEKKIILIQRKVKAFLEYTKKNKKNNIYGKKIQLKILTNFSNENRYSSIKKAINHSYTVNTFSLLNDSNNISQKEITTNENTFIITKNITNENIINENYSLSYFINLLVQKIIKYNNQFVFQKIQIFNFINKKLNHSHFSNYTYEDISILFSITKDYEPKHKTFFFNTIKRHIKINRLDNNYEEDNDINILFKENLPYLFDQKRTVNDSFPYITPIQENNLIETELFIFNDEKLADYMFKCYKIERNMLKILPNLIKNRLVKNPLLYQNIFSITRYMDILYKYYINGYICSNCFCKNGELCLSGCNCHSTTNLTQKKDIDFDVNKFNLVLKQKEKNSNKKVLKSEVLKKYRESIASTNSIKNINNTTVISETNNDGENIENINYNDSFSEFNKNSEKTQKDIKKTKKIENYKQLNKTVSYEYKIEKKINLSKYKSNSPNEKDKINNDDYSCIKRIRKSLNKKEISKIIPNCHSNSKALNEIMSKCVENKIKKNKEKMFLRDTEMDTNNQIFEDV